MSRLKDYVEALTPTPAPYLPNLLPKERSTMPNIFDDDDAGDDAGAVELLAEAMRAPTPLPPVGPDGGFAPEIAPHETFAIPEATEENFVCLRGPCRHYMETVSHYPAGNTMDSLDHEPQATSRFCLRMNRNYVDLTDECPHTCNQWIPLSAAEKKAQAKARAEYEAAKNAATKEA